MINPVINNGIENNDNGIKIISPKIPIKRKIGKVTNWNINGTAKAKYQSELIAAAAPKTSMIAIGIENKTTIHE